MASALQTLVGRPTPSVFRRAEIKRLQASDGKFESTWTDISDYVKQWGSFEASVDDIRLNRFTFGGLSLAVRNDEGKFNPETDGNSLWYGYLSRYRTMVRLQAGYYDEDDAELPTSTTQGIWVLSEEVPISAGDNHAVLNCKSLSSIFDEVKAVEVAGLGATLPASDLIGKIRDHTDGSGNFVFREFITSTSWTIQTTTAQYNLATTTTLDGLTCWDLMSKLAETEGFVVMVNREGGLEFRDREARSSTTAFHLYGLGFPEMNIIGLPETKEALNRYFNFFRLKYLSADTSTSYVSAGTSTTIDPSSTAWKYGNRIYEFEAADFFPDTATAQGVVNALLTASGAAPKKEATMMCKFLPSVEVLDRVEGNYHSFSMDGVTLWDFFDWDVGYWDSESGENINWTDKAFKIISKVSDLDNMTTTLRVQEL
jgi:hypothetical protein